MGGGSMGGGNNGDGNGGSYGSNSAVSGSGEKRKHLSEDEELAAAIKASMEGASNDNDNDNDNDIIDSNDNNNTNTNSMAVDPAPAPTTTPQTMASLFSGPSPPEPTSGGSLVQFRLPTGKKSRRRFGSSATVRDMFVAAVGMDAEIQGGRDFVLTDTSSRPPRDLREFVEQGIEGMGLNGCAVSMRYLD
ncbi:hypothetical protein ScalyP_jg380, partial [Parmales sp. scaly parma]